MDDSEAGTSGTAVAEFDVFLNHRGPDVKATFVAHLEDALVCAGFRPFLDVKSLRKGNPAFTSIDEALAVAKVHVAVVSRGYAESKYCLQELAAMMRSGKPVVPVFYDVEPEDLRRVENGPFAEAFEKHKVRGRSERKVQEWRDALGALAELTGFRLAKYKSDEARLKHDVVNEVARLTPSNQLVDVDQCRVGLKGPTHACIELLRGMGDGVGLLGLVGMGGVGKTTLAREIYNHYAGTTEFRFMTFLEIHRDSSSLDVQVRPRRCGNLREKMLWDLFRIQDNDLSYGSQFQRLRTLGAILIVIDDVHSLGQFQELVPSLRVLCPGSRIIITSRDQSVVNNFVDRANEHEVYVMSEMGVVHANKLFNLHAFHSKDAPEEFKDIAKSVVEACGGLPLALKVMGSSLFNQGLDGDGEAIWAEAIDALWQSEDVMGVLRWSYERLMEPEKLMFMDITCLFDGHRIEEAFAYWKSCKHSRGYVGFAAPHTSLRNLKNKSLIGEKSYGGLRKFTVHGLLRELGQRIAMDVKRHLINDEFLVDQDKVETIGLNLVGCQKRKFKEEDFGNMPNLLSLQLPDGCRLDGEFKRVFKKLRLLQWRMMPLERLPAGLSLSLITSLDFSESTNLASVWTKSYSSGESFPNLHSLNLYKCTCITRLPDSFGQSLQLQYLNMSYCTRLKKVPNSIGELKALQELNFMGCTRLKSLPDTLISPNLTRLNLDFCTSIKKLPLFSTQCSRLQYLSLPFCTSLKALPNSIGQLKALQYLSFDFCRSLETLPDSMSALTNLVELRASSRKSLAEIPSSIKLLPSLPVGSNLKGLIPNNVQIEDVQVQSEHLDSSSKRWSFIEGGALKRLEKFWMFNSTLIELQESFGLLTNLRTLAIQSCERLARLPNSIGDLKLLEYLSLWKCPNLRSLPKTLGALVSLKSLSLSNCEAITKLPRSINLLSTLKYLKLEECMNLKRLPRSIGQLKNLKLFKVWDCGCIEAMGVLDILHVLPIWGTTSITKLPPYLGLVSRLFVCDTLTFHESSKFSGPYEVLEEDASGVLRAYYGDIQCGDPYSLLRFCTKEEEIDFSGSYKVWEGDATGVLRAY